MYRLAPHSTFTKVVAATDIMYHVPTYHNHASEQEAPEAAAVVSNGLEEPTPDQWMEKQVALMKRITSMRTELSKTISDAAAKAAEAPAADETNAKKDKSTDKAAKKAEKAKKKEDHKSKGTVPASNKAAAEPVTPFVVTNGKPAPVDVGQSIPACTVPTFIRLPVAKSSSSISLEVTSADAGWVKILRKFLNVAKNSVKIDISEGKGEFKASIGGNVFLNRITVWQYIGEVLGLYSNEYALFALHSDRWLEHADKVIAGLVSNDTLMREASAFLSRWDTLSSASAFGIVDFVVAGVLDATKHKANNVELFVNRVNTSVA